MSKDLYSVLGLSKSASQEEIKKAYRNLSKEWHPDKHKGEKNAEQKFKEINEAYEVLGNPEKRKAYDQFGTTGGPGGGFGGAGPGGFDFSGFQNGFGGDMGDLGDLFGAFFGGGGGGRRRKTRGDDVGVQLEVSLREAFSGAERTLTLRKPLSCTTCKGVGVAEGSRMQSCAACGGTGQVARTMRSPFGTIRQAVLCDDCGGSGEKPEKPCKTCKGDGRVNGTEDVTIHIPAGIASGQVLRVRGRGGAGFRGDTAGDLGIGIDVLSDPAFTRDGDDIRSQREVSVPEVALGADIDVETLHGPVTVRVPEGSQPGDVLRIKSKGMPVLNTARHGDHYVELRVIIPKKISRAERKILEEWKTLI